MASSKTALLLGATGQTGGALLHELLASSAFSKVGEYGRRVTPADKITTGKDKLEQKTIDFENLDAAGLKDEKWDIVFITLGTTRASAGSAAAFEKIDREYVINAARAAKSDDPAHSQRVVYLSSGGANSKSFALYMRSKGLTEEGIAALGYNDTIIFRPGFLQGTHRPETRLAERVAGCVTSMLSYVTDTVEIQITTLAKSIRIAGTLGSASLPAEAKAHKEGSESAPFTVIGNAGALKLAATEK
ncbi:hypothetical protein HGRIS_005141 [Hohenbuehelia grisea]|uniref:NAD(P)-binding domain-containing protein n=1 Tax=Hohenbuehelia grisea TaxID=104357 RepID=A0ABR3JEB7_9AGAR